MKKIKYLIMILLCLLVVGCIKNNSSDSDKLKIISTIFPGYDFARAIVLDNGQVDMLVKPGVEIHTYDPSPRDIINIKSSDIFIYVGGESEEWVNDILGEIDTNKTKVIRLMDYVDLVDEELKEGMQADDDESEGDEEYDEHIWTSVRNSIKLVNAIYDAIVEKDSSNKSLYLENRDKYVSELTSLDNEISDIVSNSNRKVLVFGDRFPFRYFVLDYSLDYYAAFPGCSSDTEASIKTIKFLIDTVKEYNIPVIFKLEMSSGRQADTISSETGAKVLQLHSAHNISIDEFNSGLTYVDIVKNNIKNLREALK